MNFNKNIILELLAHKDRDKFKLFIKKYWDKNHIFALNNSVLDWQHKNVKSYNYMVAKQEDTLVGVQGIIPQSHFDRNLPKNQIFLTLWKSLEDRGIGIGLRLYQNILKNYSPEFIGVTGVDPSVIPFFKWQGFKVGMMDHHVALPAKINKLLVGDYPGNIKKKTRKLKFDVSVQKISKNELAKLDSGELYCQQLPVKSNIFIKNRYINHPIYKYEIFSISKNNKLQSLCVIRPILIGNYVVLRLVDYYGHNKSFPLLYNFVLDILEEYKAEYLDIYSYGIPTLHMQKAGFINRMKTKGLIIPNYFEPFERKNIDLFYAYKKLNNFQPVRLFKADGDQDRPNLIQPKDL